MPHTASLSHLLDVLAAGGIAAYLQPSSDLNPVTRTTTVPARPTDRLYEVLNGVKNLKALLMEVSFPNAQQELATASGHRACSKNASATSATPIMPSQMALTPTNHRMNATATPLGGSQYGTR